MRIFITGICGFIGSHIAEYYIKNGHEVFGIDNYSRFGVEKNHEYLIRKYPNSTIYNVDIRDYKNLECLLKSNGPIDAVFHCAAQTAVTTSMTDPRGDFENNAVGTFNLLEAIRVSDHEPKLIYTSTNKVYGNNVNRINVKEYDTRYQFKFTNGGIHETLPVDLTSHTPYGASKLAADLYFQEYGSTYGFTAGIFRMSCMYGTRQLGCEDQGWVFHFINSAVHETPITIYGDGKQVRDVLYISDLVNAFDCFLQNSNKTEVFNIGGGAENTLSLLELIKILEFTLDKEVKLEFREWRPSDQRVYISDISKANQVLGWEPTVSPSEGIMNILEWLRPSIKTSPL